MSSSSSRERRQEALELRLADRCRMKCDSCEVAISPDQLARERGAETVERNAKLGWQKWKVIEP